MLQTSHLPVMVDTVSIIDWPQAAATLTVRLFLRTHNVRGTLFLGTHKVTTLHLIHEAVWTFLLLSFSKRQVTKKI